MQLAARIESGAAPSTDGPMDFATRQVSRWRAGVRETAADQIAEEVPVALLYNGRPHAVMLSTPRDLEDFALGFSLSEGIIRHPGELLKLSPRTHRDGLELGIEIPLERALALAGVERALAGRTGCGMCGARTIEQAVRHPAPVADGVQIDTAVVHRTLETLQQAQRLNALTGAVHAAAWASPAGEVIAVREDVGRHNALDKLIGALSMRDTDFTKGFALVTSRASYEMVQKAATVGITLMAAISAPTALAIRLAEESRLTLIGFARTDSHVVYANGWRLNDDPKETTERED